MTGFGSIVAVAFLVGAVENPKKNVPKATLIALLLVVALYMLMIVATMGHVTTQFLIDNPGMRFIPMFAAAFTSMSNIAWLPKVISIAALLALLTTMLVVLNLTANAMKAMADDGFLPKVLTKVNKGGSPAGALVLTTIICCILACFPAWTEILVNLGSLFAAVNISLVIIAAVFARKKTTIDADAFTAPGGNVVSIITVVVILSTYVTKLFGAGNGTMWAFSIALYAIGAIVMVLGSMVLGSDTVRIVGTVVLIIGGVIFFYGTTRGKKGIGKLTAMFAAVYNELTGWFGDLLSYARLMALMLAGSVIAQVFNTLGAMPGNIFVFIIIALLGNALNFGLNLIGCYVHDLRLQCLEFFNKFYTDGGKPFRPLKVKSKFYNVTK